ncbi:MAG: hypothetical protein RLZZ77_2235 [Bacteroidota bacterium]|jgi:hypothetical protein
MKKGIVILSICCLSGLSWSQDASDNDQLFFGVKGGLNYSNVYDSKGEEFDADPKFGFAGGVFTTIPIGSFLGIQPEVLFSQKGFSAKGNVLGSEYSLTRTTSFVDVPIYFAIRPSPWVSIVAGPQYSYLVKQRDVFENGKTTIAQEQEFGSQNIRKNILCFSGGLDINTDHLVVGARVGWDVQKNTGDGTSTVPRYKNTWYQVTIGYRLY